MEILETWSYLMLPLVSPSTQLFMPFLASSGSPLKSTASIWNAMQNQASLSKLQHLIDFGELKERPIMLSPGRQELAADTRSASTLSQSKACSRAEENQFGRIFLVVASYINICSAGAMTSLLCVLPRMCSPGQEFSLWLPGRLCPTCTSSTPITKEHI